MSVCGGSVYKSEHANLRACRCKSVCILIAAYKAFLVLHYFQCHLFCLFPTFCLEWISSMFYFFKSKFNDLIENSTRQLNLLCMSIDYVYAICLNV